MNGQDQEAARYLAVEEGVVPLGDCTLTTSLLPNYNGFRLKNAKADVPKFTEFEVVCGKITEVDLFFV
jgi:hypothetical protein